MTDDELASLSISSLPLELLRSEIARRQTTKDRPSCGSGTQGHDYNTPLHVVALFLILILSTLACSFPVVVRRFPWLPVPNHALFVSRHFGTGVLIATAFCHLLPTAFVSLTDPCLPPFWNDTYPAMAGFVAMISVLVVVSLEMFFAIRGAGHSHSVDLSNVGGEEGRMKAERPQQSRRESFKPFRQLPLDGRQDAQGDDIEDIALQDQGRPYSDTPTETPSSVNKPLPRTPSSGDSDSDLDLDELDPESADDARLLNGTPIQGSQARPGHSRAVSFANSTTSRSGHHRDPATDSSERRAVLQCLLLEAGILFHSIFIGMALSVSTGPSFIVLLIAISFHQTFEGLALGSRIAAINSFRTTSPKPWLMSLMYGITTPIGQAIGLAVHGLYDPASQTGLLMVGVTNAISSGMLLYAGLVQLVAEDFLSDQSYVVLTGQRRTQACIAVFCGSMLMAFVGAFA